LLRQGLTESIVLAVLGATAGTFLALWAIDLVTEMVGAVAIRRSSPLDQRRRDSLVTPQGASLRV